MCGIYNNVIVICLVIVPVLSFFTRLWWEPNDRIHVVFIFVVPHSQLSLSSLKQQLSIISFSIGQKPRSGLAWCSAQSLVRLKSGYQVRCVSFWSLRSSCKLMWLLEEFISLGWKSPFLARCQQRATLSNWRLPAPPCHVALSTFGCCFLSGQEECVSLASNPLPPAEENLLVQGLPDQVRPPRWISH